MRFSRMVYAYLCRILNIKIDVQNLPKGKYVLIFESQEPTTKKWKIYDHKSVVKNEKGKKWIVLSQRPIPQNFSINNNGEITIIH